MDDIYPVAPEGNAVHFVGFDLSDVDPCPAGFLGGRWIDNPESEVEGGMFQGRWVGLHGLTEGHLRGRYGVNEAGERVLVVFTSPERAKPFAEHFPDFSGGLLTEFSWLLRRLGGGVPIALNPGWDIGMEFDADTIAQLIAHLPPEHSA